MMIIIGTKTDGAFALPLPTVCRTLAFA